MVATNSTASFRRARWPLPALIRSVLAIDLSRAATADDAVGANAPKSGQRAKIQGVGGRCFQVFDLDGCRMQNCFSLISTIVVELV
ncbi:MAG: hypothetical protein KDJ20_18160 [Hyphomicrobiales bacterium]|nr:hypothetical protein [Hyphomicrobiales bacterium]